MSPFRGLTWNEAEQKPTEESKRANEVKAQMKEHDYSECYCYALKNPPWGGYSIEEQIVFEAKQRRQPNGQEQHQDARRIRYSYRYANNALTGEIIVHEPFVDELPTTTDATLECESPNEPNRDVSNTVTQMLDSVSISNPAKAHVASVVAQACQINTHILEEFVARKTPRGDPSPDHRLPGPL